MRGPAWTQNATRTPAVSCARGNCTKRQIFVNPDAKQVYEAINEETREIVAMKKVPDPTYPWLQRRALHRTNAHSRD